MHSTRDRNDSVGRSQRDSRESYSSNNSTFAANQNSNPGSARSTTGYAQKLPPQLQTRDTMDGHMALEWYRKDIMTNFEGEKPRYNPMNTSRPQSSMLLNLNDTIQVHLLVETALGDSKTFELLSQEEVDDLKKRCHGLQQRIEQVRQNLVLHSKYRDAASSMAKLYSPTSKGSIDSKRSRRSLIGRHSASESLSKADEERIASERKCEELAQELCVLEKRLMEPQRRLLQHTAGILQMTHKGPARGSKINGIDQRGIPGSPESMYTYVNGRSSVEPIYEDDVFDDRSFYRSFDRLDGLGLDGHLDAHGGPTPDPESSGPPANAAQASEQLELIVQTEQNLQDLNNRLRDVILKAKSPRNESYSMPPNVEVTETETTHGGSLAAHLEYLAESIIAIDEEQARAVEELQIVTSQHRDSDIEVEEALEDINQEVRQLLLPFDPDLPVPPTITGKGLQNQITYLKSLMELVRGELERAGSEEFKGVAQLDQVETVLRGLWDIMAINEEGEGDGTSEETMPSMVESFSIQGFSTKVQHLFAQATSLKEQKQVLQRQIKQQRDLNGKADESQIQLANKLQETQTALQVAEKQADDLQAQLLTVMEQLDKSRRESTQLGLEKARKTSGETSAIRALEEKLQAQNGELVTLEEALATSQLSQASVKAELESRIQNLTSDIATVKQESATLEEALATSQLSQASVKAELESRIQNLNSDIATVKQESTTRQEALRTELRDKEAEMEEMNIRIAELVTEVTMAKAELDGAYGTRAQRAAEVAANPVIQREIDELTSRNNKLQEEIDNFKVREASLRNQMEMIRNSQSNETDERIKQLHQELTETIGEFEIMTKASLEWEKEREGLERDIDRLRDEREALEAKLSDDQVRWLGMRSPGPGSSVGGDSPSTPGLLASGKGRDTSMTVMRNEFKKMMRDTRTEHTRVLRAEQAERRRLEEELRILKKAQGPGRSGLSQSIGGG